MKAFVHRVHRMIRDDLGMETVEYAVMVALVVAILVTTLVALGGAISARFGSAQNTISGL